MDRGKRKKSVDVTGHERKKRVRAEEENKLGESLDVSGVFEVGGKYLD